MYRRCRGRSRRRIGHETKSAYVTTSHEETLPLAHTHAKEIDDVWVFRFEDFDIAAADKKELLRRLAEAIQYKRDFESRPPLTEPPPPAQDEVSDFALKFGMQSPEFMEAANAMMVASMRACGDKRREEVGRSNAAEP